MLVSTPGKKLPLKKVRQITPEMARTLLPLSAFLPLAGTVLGVKEAMPEMALLSSLAGFASFSYLKSAVPRPLFETDGKVCVPFGTDEYGLPVFIPVDELTRHMLLLGTTGSGKTTLLRYLVHTHLKNGGGVTFIDGKADVADMYAVFYTLVEDADRLEDLLVINFLNPSQSHTFNPFSVGDADFLSEVLTGLLASGKGGDSSAEYWQGRAKVMMRSLLAVLVWMRNNMNLHLDIAVIREHLSLKKLGELALNESIPLYDENGREVKSRLLKYLDELGPNWKASVKGEARGGRDPVAEQHGYAIQQWSEPLDLLGGKYGKIFRCPGGADIDMRDVVSNSRCLYVLLPSLELSPSTLRGLGRLILSTFRIAFTTQLGKDVLGEYEELEECVRATRPYPPHMLICDEYGSYAVEGFDTVLAQARSLGVAVIISVQELASLQKVGQEEAKRLIGNTNIKVALKIEDPDTSKYVVERSGEDWVFVPTVKEHRGLMTTKLGNIEGTYQYQRVSRLEQIELNELKPGNGYLLVGSELRRFSYPYIKGRKPDRMTLIKLVSEGEEGDEKNHRLASAQDVELSRVADELSLDEEFIKGVIQLRAEAGYSIMDREVVAVLEDVFKTAGRDADIESDIIYGRLMRGVEEDIDGYIERVVEEIAVAFSHVLKEKVMERFPLPGVNPFVLVREYKKRLKDVLKKRMMFVNGRIMNDYRNLFKDEEFKKAVRRNLDGIREFVKLAKYSTGDVL